MLEVQQLKPCPFCGEQVGVFVDDLDLKQLRYGIMCPSSECGIWGWFDSECEAVSSWNRRINYGDSNA